jgi:hypothetical protein
LAKKTKKLLAIKMSGRGLIPDIDTAIANEKEQGLRVRENDARMKAKLAASASEKVFIPPRRDALADRDIFLEIQASLQAGASIRLTGTMAAGVIRRRTPIHVNEWKKIKAQDMKDNRLHRQLETWIKTMWVPHWDHTGDSLKSLAWGGAMFKAKGRALTLRLGPEVIRAAGADRQGFAVHMRRRLTRKLKRASEKAGCSIPEFFFIVEDTDVTEVHLHGAILIPDDPAVYKLIRQALAEAGGEWPRARSGRQVDTPELETPLRWINYIHKWRLGSALRLQGNTFAATNGIRSLGRAWYQNARATGIVLSADRNWSDFGFVPLCAGPEP